MRNILIWCGFLLIIGTLLRLDHQKKRKKVEGTPLSAFIPCYNDGATIETTLKSLYASYPHELLEVFVINDKSTDNSLAILEKLNQSYPFHLINNKENLGKSKSLNEIIPAASHATLLIIDADTKISKANIADMLKRKVWKVAGVSCPCKPTNKGFLPLMQHIEYIMRGFIQGAYNTTSVIGMRGGCIMVDKKAFLEVGSFSYQAITEDMDLAFKLNKAWYKVEQSLTQIQTEVPATLKSRWKQRIRRWSWCFQCFVKYRKIWIKNPLHIFFICYFCVSTGVSVFYFVKDRILINTIIEANQSWTAIFFILNPKRRLTTIFTKLGFTLFALPYIIPLIKSRKDLRKIIYIIPFSLVYIPLFFVVNIGGIISCSTKYRALESGKIRGR